MQQNPTLITISDHVGRECNPHWDAPVDESDPENIYDAVSSNRYRKFEESVQSYQCPELKDTTEPVEAVLVNQYQVTLGIRKGEWNDFLEQNESEHFNNSGTPTRQIWKICPSSEKQIEPKFGEWVDVKVPPKQEGRYLCYFNTRQDKTFHISILSYKNILGFNGQFLVTHWMPLPPLPTSPNKGEKK